MSERKHEPCAGCGDGRLPRVEVKGGRVLCLACIERETGNAGIDAHGIYVLRLITDAAKLDLN